MKVLISTDTSCLIKQDVFKGYDINLFPLNVIVDGEEFLDGVSINQEQLHADMRAKKSIKTSTPPLGEVVEYFEKLLAKGYDHIIHFTISSKLSSMFELFSNVAKQNFEGKVTIINSYSLSSAMLAEVFLAYDQAQKGTPVEEIVKMVEEYKLKQNSIFFIPENLTALKNGGRISPAIAAIGNMIGLKPLIALSDGALVKDSMTRNAKKTFADKLNEVYETHPIEKYDYTVASFDGNEQLVNFIVKQIETKFDSYKVQVQPIAINVCAHCGPGTIGLIVTPKINGKSIYEF